MPSSHMSLTVIINVFVSTNKVSCSVLLFKVFSCLIIALNDQEPSKIIGKTVLLIVQ